MANIYDLTWWWISI